MSLNPPIAIGATAEIHAWKDGQVLKVFKTGISRNTVECESNLTRIVHASGLPVPRPGEVIEIDGRFGLEFERVEGLTMLQAIIKSPWRIDSYAKLLAGLQVAMHKISLPALPAQKEQLERKIRNAAPLPEEMRQAALTALVRLPVADKLCHGDFHPDNVMLTSHGPVIIDWIDASHGIPIMDIARSTLLMGGGPLPPGTPLKGLVGLMRDLFYRAYLKHYLQRSPFDKLQLSHWVPLAAAARLDENITADQARLLSLAGQLLHQP